MLKLNLPIHPILIHFPIALFVSAFAFHILGLILKKEPLTKTAWHIYVLAALFSPLVVLSGLQEADRLNLHHPVLSWHKNFGLWTMWFSLFSLPVLWFFQKKFPKIFQNLFLMALLSVVILVTFTGYNGGRLVYEYNVEEDSP